MTRPRKTAPDGAKRSVFRGKAARLLDGFNCFIRRHLILEMAPRVFLLVFGTVSCGEETPGPSFTPGTGCGFDEEDVFQFVEVELFTPGSAESCPEVTAEDVNGAEEPDCERALDGCELVVRCSMEVAEGLTVSGRGRLSAVDAGKQLAGSIEVSLGGADCLYDVLADLE
jgi:hypothetical protein